MNGSVPPSRGLLSCPVRGAILLSVLAAAVRAQESVSPPVALSTPDIEAKIQKLEGSKEIDETLKTKLLETYRQTLTRARDHESYVSTLTAYKQLAGTAPETVQGIREELKSPQSEPDLRALQGEDVAKIEAELTRAKTELGAVKSTLDQRAATISAQDARPQKIREELTRAREGLKAVETELAIPPDPNEHELLRDARAELLQIRKSARSAEIQMLEQEGVVYEARLELLKAERDRDQRAALELESRVAALEELVSTRRQAEAKRVQVEAERALAEAETKHPALLNLAQENERLGATLARVTELVERTTRTRRDVETEFNAIREAYAGARDKIEKVGLSVVLGEIFLEQRRKLPDANRYRKKSAERIREIGRIRVEQISKEEMRRGLGNLDQAARDLMDGASFAASPSQMAGFEEGARKLLQDQVELLQKVDSIYARYVKELGELDYQETQLSEQYSAYAEYLDEHLLWTPSAAILRSSTLRELPAAIAWFGAPENWRSVLEAGWNGIVERPVLSMLGGLLVLGLLLSRRWCFRRLAGLGERVGKKQSDSFGLTVTALLLTIVIAAPIPLAVVLTGQTLTGTIYTVPFAQAVGHGLVAVGSVLFVLLTYSTFCCPEGVAALHFNWSEQARAVRRNLLWLVWIGLPLLFVVQVTESFADEAYHNSIGRLAFVGGMVLVSVFAARALAPGSGVLAKTLAAHRQTWLHRLRRFWYGVAIGIPIAIAGVAVFGYYYTALRLDDRVLLSVLIVVGGVVAFQLVVRWLLIARKRLALARAREKRAAQVAAGETDPDALVELDIPEIDLATIKKQTHGIFRTAVIIGVFIGLAAVWVDVLPALGVLDRELWTVRVTTGGEDAVRVITISSVILAIAIAAFSFVASKNLPGLLEVSAVRKLPIDPGSRYAVSTIGQYVLLTTGVVLAFQTVGVSWSHVQWLVAALSVGLGFGLQEIFANFVSGLIILLERPVRVGDTVTIGEISGTVTRIRIRATTITDWDQKELVVPNKSFITGQLVNWSLSNPVTRLIVKVGIAYGSDTELALRLMYEEATKNPKVLEDPEPCVFFIGFGDSSLNFEVRVFVKELSNRARTRIVHELHMAIDRKFREHGVVISFPQRDLHIKSDERYRDGAPPYPREFDTGLD